MERAARIATVTVAKTLEGLAMNGKNPFRHILFYCFSEQAADIYRQALARLKSS